MTSGPDTSNGVAKAELSEKEANSDVISSLIGEIGRWQAVWALVIALFQMSGAFQLFGLTFQSVPKDFWCARPDNAPNMDVAFWRNLSQPVDACSILNLDYSQLPELPLPVLGSPQLIPCNKFEFFSEQDNDRTLIEEFSLVCSNANLLSVMEMSLLGGSAVGSIASGWISDSFGRKHVLMTIIALQIVVGTIVSYSINTTMYMALRVLSGFATSAISSVGLVLVLELFSGKWRTITGILGLMPISLSFILMGCIGYFVRDWRNMQLVMSLPFACFLLVWYCMPESPRWLLSQRRFHELSLLLKRAARFNHSTLPPNYQKLLEASLDDTNDQTITEQQQKKPNVEDGIYNSEPINTNVSKATVHENPLKIVFNREYWFTTILNLIVWGTLIIIYIGISLHMGNLGGDVYLNTIAAGALELVSTFVSIFVVLKFGLRRSIMTYMLVPGILCLSTILLPTQNENALPSVVIAIIARCFIGANNAILPSFTAIQYPIVVRNFAVGICSCVSGVCLLAVPYIWQLQSSYPKLPMTIMGVCGIAGGISLFLMKDIERSSKKNKS